MFLKILGFYLYARPGRWPIFGTPSFVFEGYPTPQGGCFTFLHLRHKDTGARPFDPSLQFSSIARTLSPYFTFLPLIQSKQARAFICSYFTFLQPHYISATICIILCILIVNMQLIYEKYEKNIKEVLKKHERIHTYMRISPGKY